ncbi:MAG: phosphoribosyltransferase family protein [Cyclobacteriaceae bacterium]|jgi:pyrimidine operon attenuation protein/uracil phosphoribosyltransferase|nr:phosphoribosyltransferase family protein [Cyclobacteriaceae bacterium]
MVLEKTLILDTRQIKQKIKRMAFELFENHYKEKTIVLAGIEGQGYSLAKLLSKELESISPIRAVLIKVSLQKEQPQASPTKLDVSEKEFKKKSIVLVDDVLNTGKTLAYGMRPFLETEIKSIEVAVLVNRSHTIFPIHPNYTGYQLATTITEHVEVTLGKEASVFLK